MAPGKKTAMKPMDVSELTEIEKERAKNIMTINQRMQQLGIHKLAQSFRESNARKKQSKKRNRGELVESTELEGVPLAITARGSSCKRVVAPNDLEETRRTRQSIAREKEAVEKAAAALSLVEASEVPPPLPNSTSIENVEGMDIAEEGTLAASTQVEQRGLSMGNELESLTKGLGSRIPIVIKEGKRRPEAPIQAAKMASEGGIIIWQHIPIYTSWKKYKKDKKQLDNFKGKLAIQFSMNGEKENIIAMCADMLKGGTKQMRYRLKKKFFNGVPANQVRTTSPCPMSMSDEEWRQLIEMWSDPKHKDKYAKSQVNWGKVKLHQCTRSRSYIAAAYAVKQEKYKDTEPTAVDLFKFTHCSKTKGFSDEAKKVADNMDTMLTRTVQEGEHEKTCTEVVSEVLSKSSTFLRNVGLVAAPKSSPSQMKELQAELDAEKEKSTGLEQKLHRLEAQAEASEAKTQK